MSFLLSLSRRVPLTARRSDCGRAIIIPTVLLIRGWFRLHLFTIMKSFRFRVLFPTVLPRYKLPDNSVRYTKIVRLLQVPSPDIHLVKRVFCAFNNLNWTYESGRTSDFHSKPKYLIHAVVKKWRRDDAFVRSTLSQPICVSRHIRTYYTVFETKFGFTVWDKILFFDCEWKEKKIEYLHKGAHLSYHLSAGLYLLILCLF